jgi:hypothetical protein
MAKPKTLVYSIYIYDSNWGFDDMMIVESIDKAINICERFNNGNYSGIPYSYDIDHPQRCNPLNKQWMFRPVEVWGTCSIDAGFAVTKLYPISQQITRSDRHYVNMLSGFSTQSTNMGYNFVVIGFFFWEGILNSQYPIQMLPAHADDTMICHKTSSDVTSGKKRKMI